MTKVAIIGGGISGVSLARMFLDREDLKVTVFEKKSQLGGLIACERINGALFHKVGGHVFNTKNPEVSNWFWSFFDKEKEFLKAKRNAKIYIYQNYVGYPIENYLYQLPVEIAKQSISELLSIKDQKPEQVDNFDQFLLSKFGSTLYKKYFKPYNTKIWNMDLKSIPLEWLKGKLPMPNVKDIVLSNILRQEEADMVHATFYYPVKGGSQFIIDRLSKGIEKRVNEEVTSIAKQGESFIINDKYNFDKVIYTGDVRVLDRLLQFERSVELNQSLKSVTNLKSNGTSNYLCETDPTDLSWLYLPEEKFAAHRIIYTGNFSPTNNADSKRPTCVVEFSGKHDVEDMEKEIALLPGNLTPISSNYEANSYIIHDQQTKKEIDSLKSQLESENFYLLGRFAEWQYYNMDKCIEASLYLNETLT